MTASTPATPDPRTAGVDIMRVAEKFAPEVVFLALQDQQAALASLAAEVAQARDIQSHLTRRIHLCRAELAATRQALLDLRNEVNCRIEHGANSGGHLDYVQARLDIALEGAVLPDKPALAWATPKKAGSQSD